MKKRFMTLKVLTSLVKTFKSNNSDFDLSTVGLVSVQHLLETTGSLFEAITEIGIPKDQIFITGKLYSTHQSTKQKLKDCSFHVLENSDSDTLGQYYSLLEKDCQLLWQKYIKHIDNKNIQTIIILDDGGMLIKTAPLAMLKKYKLIAIEQTSSGINMHKRNPKLPIINVARSIVKTKIEPAFISQAIINKTKMKLLALAPKNVGIIGFGCIGRGIFNDIKKAFNVRIFDTNITDNSKRTFTHYAKSIEELYLESDVIIGATGTDISFVPILEKAKTNKIFMSVSSGDIEFNELIKSYQQKAQTKVSSILDDICYTTNSGHLLKILRGGTPVNFDNDKHSVLPEHIQITRGLLFAAVIQAIKQQDHLHGTKGLIDLSYKEQMHIYTLFRKLLYKDLKKFNLPDSL